MISGWWHLMKRRPFDSIVGLLVYGVCGWIAYAYFNIP